MDQGFPARLFRLGGSPDGIRASAAGYRRFGHAATAAAERIGGLDTDQFVGPEGERFRQQLNSDLPPQLDVSGEAFSQVAHALTAFAGQLTELQARMRPLADRAPEVWRRLHAVRAAPESPASPADPDGPASAAGHVNTASPAGPASAADQAVAAGLAPNPAVALDPGAQAELRAAQLEWDALVQRASQVRAEMTAAADRCSRAISAASALRFRQPPAAWELLGQRAGEFVRDNADALKSVSEGLKAASAAVTLVGLGLQAIPFVGNAVGSALLVAGGVMAAAAVGIDLAVYSATGEGGLVGIAVDAALTFVPLGRIGALGRRAFTTAKDWSVLARSTKATAEPAIHAGSAKSVVGRWFVRDQHPWMAGERAINAPRYAAGKPGYQLNCAHNVVTVDRRLNGMEVSAAPLHVPEWPNPAALGNPHAQFHEVSAYDDIVRDVRERGAGARGLVYINRPAHPELNIKESSHVFNVVHGPHGVEFLDGQTGKLANLEENVQRIGYMPYR